MNLRPSMLARVIACTGSRAVLSDGPEDPGSVWAAKGSAAHELAAVCLEDGTYPWEHMGRVIYSDPNHGDFVVDSDMVRGVTIYVDQCRKIMKTADWHCVERRVYPPDFDMPQGGTVDFGAWRKAYGILTVCDYKNGVGVEVPLVQRDENGDMILATINAQLGSYGWGLLRELETTIAAPGDVHIIELIVVQPNARSWEGRPKSLRLFRDQFFAWVEEVAFPRIAESRDPNAPRTAGDHCRATFCPAHKFCPEVFKLRAAELIPAEAQPRLTANFGEYHAGE